MKCFCDPDSEWESHLSNSSHVLSKPKHNKNTHHFPFKTFLPSSLPCYSGTITQVQDLFSFIYHISISNPSLMQTLHSTDRLIILKHCFPMSFFYNQEFKLPTTYITKTQTPKSSIQNRIQIWPHSTFPIIHITNWQACWKNALC